MTKRKDGVEVSGVEVSGEKRRALWGMWGNVRHVRAMLWQYGGYIGECRAIWGNVGHW